MAATNGEIERRLWAAADELRANSRLKASEYSMPVLGLIFLRYADFKFSHAERQLADQATSRRRTIGKHHYQAQGVMYVPEEARFDRLLELPEGTNLGQAINCRSDEFMGSLASVAGGTSTSHQRVKPDHVLSTEIAIPDKDLMSTFTQFVAPLLKLSLQLRERNEVLSKTRDLLLPRLVSGQVDVTAVGESAREYVVS